MPLRFKGTLTYDPYLFNREENGRLVPNYIWASRITNIVAFFFVTSCHYDQSEYIFAGFQVEVFEIKLKELPSKCK